MNRKVGKNYEKIFLVCCFLAASGGKINKLVGPIDRKNPKGIREEKTKNRFDRPKSTTKDLWKPKRNEKRFGLKKSGAIKS